jgi:hypothetical protein
MELLKFGSGRIAVRGFIRFYDIVSYREFCAYAHGKQRRDTQDGGRT